MWQGAHGRLATIAMLAGGLSGCATTPRPVQDDEPDDHTRFLCGGNDSPPTPESVSADSAAKVRASCDAGSTAGTDRLCAVTLEGRVKCDREWPASAKPRTPGPAYGELRARSPRCRAREVHNAAAAPQTSLGGECSAGGKFLRTHARARAPASECAGGERGARCAQRERGSPVRDEGRIPVRPPREGARPDRRRGGASGHVFGSLDGRHREG